MRRFASYSLSLAAAIFVLQCVIPAALSRGEYIMEDPSALEPGQEWFLIQFDASGTCTRNEGWGYGGGWHYYPLEHAYRQWYYRGPYDATQSACMTICAGIVSLDPNRLATAEIRVVWSTPAWTATGSGRPPLPSDVADQTNEQMYVGSDAFQSVSPSFFGTVEPWRDYIISAYSPEWVGIEVTGKSVKILRWVAPTCDSGAVLGACCNASTGECFLTDESDCTAPYTWKGANTTCESCGGSAGSTLDFGDAPDTYGTALKNDGARHTIVSGVYLGRLIDGESNGLPTSSAAGDDSNDVDDEDGVTFTKSLTPGAQATLEVTASVQGYLNAWVDFDRDGSFGDAGEQIFSDMPLALGTNSLAFTVPAGAALGDTFARFRFNRRGLLSWSGLASDGEVEDYKVSIAGSFEPQASSNRGAAKWVQTPATTSPTSFVFDGWTELSDTYLTQIPADDWTSDNSYPVTGFQWWGGFKDWAELRMPSPLPTAFHLALWTNRAATNSKDSFAHPNTLVWETTSTNWTWNVAGRADDPRKINSDEAAFEFTCLLSQDQWFYPDSGNGTKTYWLSIAAVYDTTPVAHPWGWMTQPYSSGNSAVRITAVDSSAGSTTWPPNNGDVWNTGSQIADGQSAMQDMTFNVLTNVGSGLYDLNLAPVYRFWSASLLTHFYTINEAEKQKLVDQMADVWQYEGVAFYAYPPGSQPTSALPVYRFRSASDGHHFYTISEGEKNKLMSTVPNQWIYDGVMWYAYRTSSQS